MKLFTHGSTSPIGLDIGSHSIKAIQTSGNQNPPAINAITSIIRTNPTTLLNAEDAQSLKQTLKTSGFNGHELIISVPHDQQLTALLELPPRGTDVPIDQIAKMEFARLHRCGVDEVEMSFWDLPAPARAAQATHTMAAGCKHQDANGLMDTLEGAGFYIKAIDTHAWSIVRACTDLLPEQGMTMILDLGYSATRLILVINHVVVYERSFTDAGMNTLIKTVSKATGSTTEATALLIHNTAILSNYASTNINTDEDPVAKATTQHYQSIASEVRASTSFAAHRFPNAELSKLLLVGGVASSPGITDFFTSALELDSQVVCLGDIAETSGAQSELSVAVAAMGLANFGRI